jgi:hypothetical protein
MQFLATRQTVRIGMARYLMTNAIEQDDNGSEAAVVVIPVPS